MKVVHMEHLEVVLVDLPPNENSLLYVRDNGQWRRVEEYLVPFREGQVLEAAYQDYKAKESK